MIHELTIRYDDEKRFVQLSPGHILTDRALCYAMLGMANELVIRNGLSAPAFQPEQKQKADSATATWGVQPCKVILTPPED